MGKANPRPASRAARIYKVPGAAMKVRSGGSAAPTGVLLTRPLEQAAPLTEEVSERGWRSVLAPLLEIHPRRWRHEVLGGAQAILLTSRNAARELARSPLSNRSVPVHCVGRATAEPLLDAGFTSVHWSNGTALGLAHTVSVALAPRDGPLAYLSGEVISRDLGSLLAPLGFEVRREIVYEARQARVLPEAATRAIMTGELAAALFLSVRTARAFSSLVRAARLEAACRPLTAVVLSQPIGDALRPLDFGALRVARTPDRPALLTILGRPGAAT
ncbi:uroporphyrinogen-III synthase [Methylobacterium radiodurans]|uniref:Uroporphyrinogen-III synthase n=1 Tax=Methylobacterium radiodurans TaxID=2202828 RepID=A0A2U8VND3_9HYPH|nr:uroporphyrinogen-III synthase [Methylobacterium radiodurans]